MSAQMASGMLRKILATKAAEVAEAKRRLPLHELTARAGGLSPARGFTRRIREVSAAGPAVIAEIKKASPSVGVIRADFHPAQIASSYQAGGAACLSVLTDTPYFQGANQYLEQARAACELPVLRKDFLLDPWQIHESRLLGADCVLLIAAVLEPGQLRDLDGLAHDIGLDVLVEVHDEHELEHALETRAALIGVNNRDLRTFKTDLGLSQRLRPLIPEPRTMVAESGIHERGDVERLLRSGVEVFLVGEALMRAADPGSALQSLFRPQHKEANHD